MVEKENPITAKVVQPQIITLAKQDIFESYLKIYTDIYALNHQLRH